MTDTWYRVEANSVNDLVVLEYTVCRRTRCGVWVESKYGSAARFVNASARKRFACPTISEAVDSFIARKKRQRKILRSQLQVCERLLSAVEDDRPTLEKHRILAAGRIRRLA